jgi:hypothetical protein
MYKNYVNKNWSDNLIKFNWNDNNTNLNNILVISSGKYDVISNNNVENFY